MSVGGAESGLGWVRKKRDGVGAGGQADDLLRRSFEDNGAADGVPHTNWCNDWEKAVGAAEKRRKLVVARRISPQLLTLGWGLDTFRRFHEFLERTVW